MENRIATPDRHQASRAFDAEEVFARQVLYSLAAAALADPLGGAWEFLSHSITQRIGLLAAGYVRDLKAAAADPLSPGERPLDCLDPEPLFARLPRRPAELNALYERTFGLLSVGRCPACETEYIHGKQTFQRSQDLADVSGFYAAFGLDRAPRQAERHDHVSLEFEFMSRLLGLEREAESLLTEQGAARAEICRKAQTRFLREHLAWWAPAFARLLARESPNGYYAAVAEFIAALIAAERSLLGVAPIFDFAQPMTIERPEECDGCFVAASAIGLQT